MRNLSAIISINKSEDVDIMGGKQQYAGDLK